MRGTRTGLWTVFALAMAVAGCRGTHLPELFGPGPAPYQREVAEQFDPYPEPDIGPDPGGTRPPDFRRPVSEPARARRTQWGAPPLP